MRKKKMSRSASAVARGDVVDNDVPRSTGQKVYSLLREQILSLSLPPNAELDEVQFSTEFGFSRTPIREAFIRLAADGLVILAPNRGARVAPLDLDQVPQVLEALELYERATTRWATLRRKPQDIERLERRNREFAVAFGTGDPRLIVEANWAFHDAINQACGNKFMAADCSKMLREVMRLSLLAFRQDRSALANYSDITQQHQDMIEAIRAGDADLAEQLVFQHSDDFRERMRVFVAGVSTAGFSMTARTARKVSGPR